MRQRTFGQLINRRTSHDINITYPSTPFGYSSNVVCGEVDRGGCDLWPKTSYSSSTSMVKAAQEMPGLPVAPVNSELSELHAIEHNHEKNEMNRS